MTYELSLQKIERGHWSYVWTFSRDAVLTGTVKGSREKAETEAYRDIANQAIVVVDETGDEDAPCSKR